MTKTVVVRLAQVGDRGQVWPLAQAFATSFELDRDLFDASFDQLLADPDALLSVAVTSTGSIVGCLLAFTHHTFLANGPVTWVEEIMVAERARRAGIGRSLVITAESWSASKGAAYVALATRRAADFYRSMGYVESAAFYRKLNG